MAVVTVAIRVSESPVPGDGPASGSSMSMPPTIFTDSMIQGSETCTICTGVKINYFENNSK